MRGEGLHPECFRGVMTAVEDIKAKFFCECVSPVRTFTGDERVHPFSRGGFQIAARTTRHNADAPTELRTTRDQLWFCARRAGQSRDKFIAGNVRTGLQADGLAVAREKRFEFLETERGGELGVVAEFGMRVEWQVGTVNSDVV